MIAYIYSYGRKRHIHDGGEHPGHALCGYYGQSEQVMVEFELAWVGDSTRRIATKKRLPICQHCADKKRLAEVEESLT